MEKHQTLLSGLTFGGKAKAELTGEVEFAFTPRLDKDKDGKVIELEETTIDNNTGRRRCVKKRGKPR